MQKTTGTLSPGAHAGSYNGQDAYNDLLVVDENIRNASDRNVQGIGCGVCTESERPQGCDRPCDRSGGGMTVGNVRRLTPEECEMLQGFPKGWTDIGEWADDKGRIHKPADSPRYRAIGNSICLPFWQWLARKTCAQYERDITVGSLFDGMSGFPLVFSRCGAIPLWSSEIDPFCQAVSKSHFPEGENDGCTD